MADSLKYEILCYGDSNTWGTIAKWKDEGLSSRYDRNTRWPCVMQKELGDDYAVNEEGLGGRTTIYTSDDERPYKNGINMLIGCLASHRPLDLVILYLGTNDLHLEKKIPEENLGDGIRTLIETVKNNPNFGPDGERAPEILVVAPTYIKPSSPLGRVNVYDKFYREYGERLSRLFPSVYKEIANETGCYFISAQDYAEPDMGDGVHITGESHIRLGKAMAKKVMEIRENGRVHDRA